MPADPLSPPRPELLLLLDAVKDNPDDDTPRLVLADWLDEQDNEPDASRARFIRDHIAIVRSARLSDWNDWAERSAAARQRLGPLAGFTSGHDRGLPVLDVSGPQFLKSEFLRLLPTEAFAFVAFVRLSEAGGSRLEKMSALSEFRFVPGVSASPFTAPGSLSAAKFFSSPHLTGVRRIEFRGVRPGAVGVQAAADNPALSRLRKLSLVHNKVVDKAAAALAGSPRLANLTHLNLADNNIGDAGAAALAGSLHLANLLELDLRDNPRLTKEGQRVLRDKFGDHVRL